MKALMMFRISFKATLIFTLLLFLTSCSTIGEYASGITDKIRIGDWVEKTESWIYGEEETVQEVNLEKDTQRNNTEENVIEIQENEELTIIEENEYPDVRKVPTEVDIDSEIEIDFVELKEESRENITANNKNVQSVSDPEKIILLRTSIVPGNVAKMVAVMLRNSDPLSDLNAPLINFQKKDLQEIDVPDEEKIAIIQFGNDSDVPDEDAIEVISQITRIDQLRSKTIKLVGHASTRGSNTEDGRRYNMDISFARAKSVKNMLINNGFPADNIVLDAKGDTQPLFQENDKYGESGNRRVEIYITP